MFTPLFVAPSRIDRALRTSTAMTARVELWSNDDLLTASAPFIGGEVTDAWGSTNIGIGIRRSMSLTIPPTTQWIQWLDKPGLEARPYRGVVVSPTETAECPLGRFNFNTPSMTRPAAAVSVAATDYYNRIIAADFTQPVMWNGGLVTDVIASLLTTCYPYQGLPWPIITATSKATATQQLLGSSSQSRHDAIVAYAKSIGVEVYLDRSGVPVIADSETISNTPTTDLLGLVEDMQRDPQWDKVYNVVHVTSSANNVTLSPEAGRAGITWSGHPADPRRLGTKTYPIYRVYKEASPLIYTDTQADEAAYTILARVSAIAETYSMTGIPDPRIDAGDSIIIPTVTGGWKIAQVSSVTHPLTVEGRQKIVTVASNTLTSTDYIRVVDGQSPVRFAIATFTGAGSLTATATPAVKVEAPYSNTYSDAYGV